MFDFFHGRPVCMERRFFYGFSCYYCLRNVCITEVGMTLFGGNI